jgi:UDP-N-acetylglucosamine 2-epimerase (non-hydrolysing)
VRRVLVVLGTRPEVIKLAPVVRALRARPEEFAVRTCATGQHRDMLAQALATFELAPDTRLDVMEASETLAGLTARLFVDLDRVVAREEPEWVVVQGDTTSAMVGAMTAFYRRVKVAHVEAGLRTGNRAAPFPEETNRTVIARVADLHFAPTLRAEANLLQEGVDARAVHMVGNTVVDALHWVLDRMGTQVPPGIDDELVRFITGRRVLLVTSHRRESFGEGLAGICDALIDIVERHPDVVAVYPVHLNPNVNGPVHARLGRHPRIRLLEPLGYLPLLWLMRESACILTDSGGIQEEAPSVGKRVLVLREVTERPEVIETGWGELVGTSRAAIVRTASMELRRVAAGDRSHPGANPFGDGKAAERIATLLEGRAGS